MRLRLRRDDCLSSRLLFVAISQRAISVPSSCLERELSDQVSACLSNTITNNFP